MERAKILVVANPYEAARIAAWLEGGGLPMAGPVRLGDGSDETLAEFAAEPADLIVLVAALEAGDSLALATALRTEGPRHLKIVLIGDEHGPVRTALDAVDFAADRFLRRPLAEKALVFAVRSCLEPKPPRQMTQRGIGPRASSVGGIAAGMVTGGVGAARVAGGVAGGLAGQVTQPGVSAQTAVLDELERAPAASPAAAPAGSDLIARLEQVTSTMLDAFLADAVSKTVDETVGAEVVSAIEYTAEPGDAENELLAPQITSDFEPQPQPAPPWREPTLILSAGSAPVGPPGTPAPDPVMAAVAAAAATEAASGEAVAAEAAPAPAGTLARELRRTMSAIEKRLFGDESGDEAARDLGDDEPDADIDLDKIGGATSPGFLAEMAGAPAEPPAAAPTMPGDSGIFEPSGPASGTHTLDLAREDTAALLARLHDEGFTGKLTFSRDDVEKLIFLDVGRPVFAHSNLPHDRMGDLLYREGKITREQYARSREIVAGTGRRMGEILVEMGFLKRRELLPAVRRHVEDIMYSLFAWDTGTVTLSPGDAAQDEKIRLATHPTALLFEGIRRKMDLPRLRRRVGGDETVIAPLKRDDIASALAEADLAAEERAAADLFDGRRTLAEVVAISRIDATSVWQLAHALLALGLVRAYEKGRELAESARVPAQPLSGAADLAIDRERVLAKHSHVLEADYFQVLGVRRDASAFEIKRAWEAARRDYAPDAFPLEVQRDLGESLREIAAIVDEAFRVLRDGAVRTQYLENLKE